MAVKMKPASADTVRAWAAETGWTDEFDREPKDRGRLPSSLIADFDKAHKRNRIEYTPGYKDENTEAATNGRATASSSTEVATRPASRTPAASRSTRTEKAEKAPAAPAPRNGRTRRNASDNNDQPIRVQAERMSNEVAQMPGVQSINIEDAIALLSSAASTKKKGDAPTGMLAYYVLV